ncbi:MAG: hypothetical protein WC254_06755 [Candidatus Woesearchaeota archaeon]|jgi:hypothetical protein
MTEIAELTERIEGAIVFLAPKFGVSEEELKGFRRPTVEICESNDETKVSPGEYYFDTNTVSIASDSFDKSIGEEVSHYLHHRINTTLFPEIQRRERKKDETSRVGTTLLEVVGRYGKIVHDVSQGNQFELLPSDFFLNLYGSPLLNVNEVIAHEIGYRRAERAYMMHGEFLLPRLARLTLDEGIVTLPRLLPITWYERKVLPVVDRIRGYKFT